MGHPSDPYHPPDPIEIERGEKVMGIKVHGLSDKVKFGKHRGKSVEDIISSDPQWLFWAVENVDDFDIDKDAEAELEASL